MKVLIKTIITLSLAVPLNLVSADEVRNAVDTHILGQGGDNHIQDIKEVKQLAPMTFKDIVVVKPRIETTATDNSDRTITHIKQHNYSGNEIALNDAK